jgi:hypothetical protein
MNALEELSRMPLDTGKVVIGSRYVRPERVRDMSSTELRIQRALLGKKLSLTERVRKWLGHAQA